jgi:hypothetical protein
VIGLRPGVAEIFDIASIGGVVLVAVLCYPDKSAAREDPVA